MQSLIVVYVGVQFSSALKLEVQGFFKGEGRNPYVYEAVYRALLGTKSQALWTWEICCHSPTLALSSSSTILLELKANRGRPMGMRSERAGGAQLLLPDPA